MTAPEGKLKAGRRPNRRGEASRKHVLDIALRLLATGGPEAVSVKLIAKEANVTWGTVQYQFGDADGFWAATVLHILDTAGPHVWARPSAGSVDRRIAEIIELLWKAYGSPYNAAVSNLRAALAKNRAELERSYPRTAAALDALEDSLLKQFREFFDGITVDPRHARQVSALLPAALRGLYTERSFGSRVDIDDALAGLREAITLYMTPAPADSKRFRRSARADR
jgi:AcrR family transcriptional regulator